MCVCVSAVFVERGARGQDGGCCCIDDVKREKINGREGVGGSGDMVSCDGDDIRWDYDCGYSMGLGMKMGLGG